MVRCPRPLAFLVALSACLAIALTTASALAQGATSVPYTVQVAALSDPEAAIDLSGSLLRGGFPAYVVRAEGAAGSVFRVRVAAFGDRASAERYASALGERRGSEPRPALAEAIPAGILPLAPTRLFAAAGDERAVVAAWGPDRIALRTGPVDGEASWRVDDGTAFDAWWAEPRPNGGRHEIARSALDEPAASEDTPSVRDALFRQRLRLVAEQAGVEVERLETEAVRGEPGDRHLVVWRTVGAGEEDGVHAILVRDASPVTRAADAWLGGVPPEPAAPLLVLASDEDGAAASARADVGEDGGEDGGEEVGENVGEGAGEEAAADVDGADGEAAAVEGDGWRARSDGIWTVIETNDATWRALIGAPRAASGDLLVIETAGSTELVRLSPR